MAGTELCHYGVEAAAAGSEQGRLRRMGLPLTVALELESLRVRYAPALGRAAAGDYSAEAELGALARQLDRLLARRPDARQPSGV